jgi:hypothetical protein
MRTVLFRCKTYAKKAQVPTVNHLSTQKPSKRLVIRWATLKGLVAIILFLLIATLIEYAIVLYAMNIGVKEKPEALLQWTFSFPGTNWIVTITVSPLFNLVPIAVIIMLAFCWIYLTRQTAIKPSEVRRGKVELGAKRVKESRVKEFFGKIKAGLLKIKGFAYVWQKIHFARATIKSALTVLIVFATFILLVSLFAYPRLIYQAISNAYQSNPSLFNFVKGTSQALASLGGVLNSALLGAAPSFRNFALGLGSVIGPLASLDNAGKYLVFQNIAAWISALITILYGEYIRKGYRYRARRKS